jgi:hypothetical protein
MVKIATEIFLSVQKAHDDNAISCIKISEWFARFLDSHENLDDDEFGKHLNTSHDTSSSVIDFIK